MRVKILLFVSSLGGGGAQRVFCTLLKHLDRDRFDLHLAILSTEGQYMSEVPADVTIHHLKSSRARHALPGLIRLVRILRPSAVLSTLPQCNYVLLLSRLFLPGGTRVFVRESQPPTHSFSEFSRAQQVLQRYILYRLLFRHADKIICLYDGMVTEFATQFKIPRNKLVRIYNPLDSDQLKRVSDALPNPYSGPGPQLVAVGRLSWEKGLDVLLEAITRVRVDFPQAKLTILGQGELEQSLREKAQNLGLSESAEFVGFQQNPWQFVKHADLFVLPSRFEGLSNALLEAMALQKNIVAADCPGAMRELKDLNPGLTLVPPNDPDALARAIISNCRARTNEDPSHCRWSLQPFSLNQVMTQYSELFVGHP